MGNALSNLAPLEVGSGDRTKRDYRQQPLTSINPLNHGAFLSPISRSHCDAAAAPPPLPPPTDPKAPPPPPAAAAETTTTTSKEAPPPPATPEEEAIAKAAASSSRYNNPGPYEQGAMDAKRLVSLDVWEGFRCDVSKQMNPYMMVVHSFGMSPASAPSPSPMGPPPQPPSSYAMVAQVGDESGVLVSRMDTARGGIDGRVQRILLGGLAMGKLQLSLSNSDNDMFLAELDVGTTIPAFTWTANLKYGSMGGGPCWGGNFWQAVTPQLTLGAEGMYIAAQGAAVSSYAAKYNFQAPLTQQEQDEAAASANAKSSTPPGPPGMPPPEVAGASSLCANFHGGNGVLTLNYRRVITPNRVVAGAELAVPVMDPFGTAPDVLLGAEFNLTRSKLQFSLDGTTGKLSSLLETKLGMGPAAPRFGLCAQVDHYNQDYKFGYQINIEG